MTPDTTGETVDGISREKIKTMIDLIRQERWRWTPVKRVYIPKKSGKLRPLGLPSWSSKVMQEVVRQLLDAYFEPTFSDRSHGFRPGRGCHTALSEIVHGWKGVHWVIEGDISDCFGRLDHEVLLNILSERIHDNRFLRLIRHMLQAGDLEEWRWHETLSGAPQGGVCSPILSNIYLDKFDKFVETELLPKYKREKRRQKNPAYQSIEHALARTKRKGDRQAVRALRQQRRKLSSQDPQDPTYRRLGYVRDADDWALGFSGPKAEAEEIKRDIRTFLRETLKLELSEAKTLITHTRTSAAKFLSYEIVSQQRVLADRCELCGSKEKVEVHHIRKLADLEKPGRRAKPAWVKQMAARRRKTLIVCRKCHEAIHAGTSTASFRKQGLESRMTPKGSSPVRKVATRGCFCSCWD